MRAHRLKIHPVTGYVGIIKAYTNAVKAGDGNSRELIKRFGILTIARGYTGSGNGKRHARSKKGIGDPLVYSHLPEAQGEEKGGEKLSPIDTVR